MHMQLTDYFILRPKSNIFNLDNDLLAGLLHPKMWCQTSLPAHLGQFLSRFWLLPKVWYFIECYYSDLLISIKILDTMMRNSGGCFFHPKSRLACNAYYYNTPYICGAIPHCSTLSETGLHIWQLSRLKAGIPCTGCQSLASFPPPKS